MSVTKVRAGSVRRIAPVLLLGLLFGCSKTADQWAQAGEAALKAYKLDEAEQAFQKALEKDPLSPSALYGIGWIYSTRQDTAAARIYYERCIQAAPNYYGGYKGMGSIHLAQGFYEQAEASLKRAVELKPDEASSHGSLGYVYLVTRRLDLAEKEFQTALKLEPGRGELHYLMAELRMRQGALDAALEELEQGETKPFEEVKFRLLMEELRGRLYLQKVVRELPSGDVPVPEASVKARLELLDRADKALDAALGMAFVEERAQLYQLKKKVQAVRDRLAPPPL